MALTPDRPQGTIPAWSNSHRENRQLSSCSSHVPKPLPQLYPAKSAKSHGTAEPVSAQINQHSHALCDVPHDRHHRRAFGATGLWLGQG